MKKKNVNDFFAQKKQSLPITMVTCYDFSTAKIINTTAIDIVLIGDSGGNVFAGYDSTLPVTVDEMIYHTRAVKRGAPDKFIVADMPFMSYHPSVHDAVANAGRLVKEGGAHAVKLEGGAEFSEEVRMIVRASIPVVGHLGLMPQSVNKTGGYKVQGRDKDDAEKIIYDAKALEECGVFAIVLEMVPEALAGAVARSVSVPVIGIGAGRECDGQVLVINDLLGMDPSYNPKYLKKYADLGSVIKGAVDEYCSDVVTKNFPGKENIFE